MTKQTKNTVTTPTTKTMNSGTTTKTMNNGTTKKTGIKKIIKIKKKKTKTKTKTTTTSKNIIYNFKILVNKTFAMQEKGATFKAREYNDVIKAFLQFNSNKITLAIAEKVLVNFGKKKPTKSLKKIDEIIKNGKLKVVEEALKNKLVLAVMNLTNIYGIGYKKAIKLANEHNITTIPELKLMIQTNKSILNSKQKIGLKYYDDLEKRIPRKEMLEYEQILLNEAKLFNNNIILSINGSFRRKEATSGDIDVLITSENGNTSEIRKNFIKHLKTKNIIIETLANGKKKFMGISKIPSSLYYRHIDIIDTTKKEYPFAVLYFTGSGGFNANMRQLALKKGFSLNEYCLSNSKTKIPISQEEIKNKIGKTQFQNEEDIFNFLELEYVKPENRNNLTLSKI